MFLFFGYEACGIFAHQPGMELAPPALEGQSEPLAPREVPENASWLQFTCNLFQEAVGQM